MSFRAVLCTPPAENADPSLDGSGKAGPGACTPPVAEPRNKDKWLSIADFLAPQNLRAVLARRIRESASDSY